MNTPLQQCLTWSRRAQHWLDPLMGAGLLAVGLWVMNWNTQTEQQKITQTVSRIPMPTQQPTARQGKWVDWNTPLDNNALQQFDTWRVQTHVVQGMCDMNALILHCRGVQDPSHTLTPASFESIELIKPSKEAAQEPSKPKTDETPEVRQNGWVQTPLGKRRFNPKTQRWSK